MRQTVSGICAVVAIASTALACGSTSNDGGSVPDAGGQSDATASIDGPSDAPSDTVDATSCSLDPDTSGTAQAIADSACTPHGDCCTQIGLAFETATCVQALAPKLQQLIDAARCRGAQYDPTGVADCIAAMKAYAQSCPMNYSGGLGALYELSQQACSHVLDGTQQPGEPCDSHFDCVQAQGSVTECVSSQCLRTTYGQQGASCDPFAEPLRPECNEYDGLICKNDTCEALIPIGDPCTSTIYCVPEAYCEQGTCQPRKALGEACADDCEPLLTCVNGTCGGTLGDPCTADSECASHQCASGKCAPRNHFVSVIAGMNCH